MNIMLTKAAINALVRALGVELARHGVTANAILPWLDQERHDRRHHGQRQIRRQCDAPDSGAALRRATDFGGIAVYLMSKASSYHTADTFVIDGGYAAF